MEAELRIEDNEFIGVRVTGSCDCISRARIAIPDSVALIADNMFHHCIALTQVNIPDSVVYIGKHAFSDCYSLTDITIPDSVEYIGDDAFSGCTSLRSIRVPKHFDAEAVKRWDLPDTCEIVWH